MIRLVVSYTLTSLILLSQVGLPVHFHYCKGMLESVSVFFQQGCDDHIEVAELPSCCKKDVASHCSKEKDNCCDDQIKILTQDITSLTPHFVKWVDMVSAIRLPGVSEFTTPVDKQALYTISDVRSDNGPPDYIRYHALIFYA